MNSTIYRMRFRVGVLLAAGLATNAAAAPRLALDTVQAAPGELAYVSLRMVTSYSSCAGFNATVYLPMGVTLVGVTRGALLPSPGFRLQSLPLADPALNAVAILGYSDTQTFSATGSLCTLNLQLGPSIGPGDYPLILAAADRSPLVRGSHALSSSDGSTSASHTAGDGLLKVRRPGVAGDSNGNGIPDAWEQVHFGTITNVNDTTDFDGDGLSDYREYLSETDPTNSLSCLALVEARPQGAATGGVVLTWYSIPGYTYRVERAEALAAPFAFDPVGMDLLPTPPLNVYTDQPPGTAGASYYRVRMTAE